MSKLKINRSFWDKLIDLSLPIIAVLGAFAVGAVILWLQGVNPIEAYSAMIYGAFGTKNGLSDTLVKSVPLMLVALGIAIAFGEG